MGNTELSLAELDMEEVAESFNVLDTDIPSFPDTFTSPKDEVVASFASGISSVIFTQTLQAIGVASLSIIKILGIVESSDEEEPVVPRKILRTQSCPAITKLKDYS